MVGIAPSLTFIYPGFDCDSYAPKSPNGPRSQVLRLAVVVGQLQGLLQSSGAAKQLYHDAQRVVARSDAHASKFRIGGAWKDQIHVAPL